MRETPEAMPTATEAGSPEPPSEPLVPEPVGDAPKLPPMSAEAIRDVVPAADTDERHESDPGASEGGTPSRPEFLPEKFWDAERGEPRLEALARSYRELESKLGRMIALPTDETDEAGQARLRRALGWPESPEDYEIEPPHPLLEPDPELNRRLHEAGFTRRQAQLVYDLAAEHVLPAVAEAVSELESARERARLEQHFGGPEAFETVSRQIRKWAEANLEPDVFEALAGSYRGVLALHQMMRSGEPEVVGEPGDGALPVTEQALQEMMRDPRYWRDRDPDFVARVTNGFRQLYGE